MSAFNPLQEAVLPHLSDQELRQILDDARELTRENAKLKERVEYLERQIVTLAYGGVQAH